MLNALGAFHTLGQYFLRFNEAVAFVSIYLYYVTAQLRFLHLSAFMGYV